MLQLARELLRVPVRMSHDGFTHPHMMIPDVYERVLCSTQAATLRWNVTRPGSQACMKDVIVKGAQLGCLPRVLV